MPACCHSASVILPRVSSGEVAPGRRRRGPGSRASRARPGMQAGRGAFIWRRSACCTNTRTSDLVPAAPVELPQPTPSSARSLCFPGRCAVARRAGVASVAGWLTCRSSERRCTATSPPPSSSGLARGPMVPRAIGQWPGKAARRAPTAATIDAARWVLGTRPRMTAVLLPRRFPLRTYYYFYSAYSHHSHFTTHYSLPTHHSPLTTAIPPTYPRTPPPCDTALVPLHRGRASKAFWCGGGIGRSGQTIPHAAVTAGRCRAPLRRGGNGGGHPPRDHRPWGAA